MRSGEYKVTHVRLRCCYRRARNFFQPRWRHFCWLARCEEISWHYEYKCGMVYRGCWWNVCFVLVRYCIIITQIFHALKMVCYLVGQSYKFGVACICYWQTISCLMANCGLWITNSSLWVIWDAYLIWIRSVYKRMHIQTHWMKLGFHGMVAD